MARKTTAETPEAKTEMRPAVAVAVKESTYPADVAESRTVLNTKPEKGMAFYESPEGYIVVAEEGKQRVWCRKANNGKGMFINPRRD